MAQILGSCFEGLRRLANPLAKLGKHLPEAMRVKIGSPVPVKASLKMARIGAGGPCLAADCHLRGAGDFLAGVFHHNASDRDCCARPGAAGLRCLSLAGQRVQIAHHGFHPLVKHMGIDLRR